ncbi:MAG: outer membrane beta-barrel protein [Phocaeicola sp.]
MKSKLIAFSLLLAGTAITAKAQDHFQANKWSDNVFVGAGIGGMSVINSGFNAPTLNIGLSAGKHLTPIWSVRGQINGLWANLDAKNSITNHKIKNKKFIEGNIDAMVNLTTLIDGYKAERLFDVYAFGGPTLMALRSVDGNGKSVKVNAGASAGVGVAYNLNSNLALNMEGRFTFAPSTFLSWSDQKSFETKGVLSIGATYTFGRK